MVLYSLLPCVIIIGGITIGVISAVKPPMNLLLPLSLSMIISIIVIVTMYWMSTTRVSYATIYAQNYIIMALLVLAAISYMVNYKYGSMYRYLLGFILIVMSIFPLWYYLKSDDRTIPVVPIVSLVYGVFYGVPALLGDVPSKYQEKLYGADVQALGLALCGLLVFLLSYYLFPGKLWYHCIPRFNIEWNASLARHMAHILSLAGIIGIYIQRFHEYPDIIGVAVNLARNMGYVGMATLLLFQFNGKMRLGELGYLWCVIIGGQLAIIVGGGSLYEVAKMAALIMMLYILFKRRIPWKWIAIGIPILCLFMIVKPVFRALTWEENRPTQGNPIQRSVEFYDMAVDYVGNTNMARTIETFHDIVISRLNHLSLFSYVMEMTPEYIPYWSGESYGPLLWKVVPRIIYPDKPMEVMGQVFGHRYGLLHRDDLETSVNMPQLIEMYVNYGVSGVIIGMVVMGIMYNMIGYMINHPSGGSWSRVSSAVIFSSFVNIESNFSLLYGGLIHILPVLFILGLIVNYRSLPCDYPKST